MSSTLKSKLADVWALVLIEVGIDVRLARFWIMLSFALIVGVSNAIGQVNVHASLSAITSGVLMHSPLLAPMTIFPDFQVIITFGLVFFAIEIVSRDHIARIDEVVACLPISNNQIVFARAFGQILLLFLILAGFVFGYFLLGMVMESAVPAVGFGPPEFLSMLATLVVDALPYLCFWTGIVMFLTAVLRLRVLAAAIAIGLMLLMYWLQNNLPMFWLNTLGTYSLSTQLPSELSPVFTSADIVLHRVNLVVLATALLFWTAILIPRRDRFRSRNPVLIACMTTLVAASGIAMVQVKTLSLQDVRERWLETHLQVPITQQIDISKLTGELVIDPGSTFDAAYQLEFRLLQEMADQDSLFFSFNPGYEIQEITVNERPASFSFEDGLLQIEAGTRYKPNDVMSMTIKANGEIDEEFAYLDAAVSARTSDAVSAYGLLLMGSKPALNRKDYVALPPGIAWYPMPGSHVKRDESSIRSRDYFNIDVAVIMPEDWRVAGPGTAAVELLANQSKTLFEPLNPIHEIGLFAAPFERRTRTIAGIDFELLISGENVRNLDLTLGAQQEILGHIEQQIESHRNQGFEFPFDTYTIVEIPTYLRTYGGGWRMNSVQSLPGIYLLREGTFLTANFLAIADRIESDTELTDSEKGQRLLSSVRKYFENNLFGGDIVQAFADNYVRMATQPSGEHADWLGFVLDYLADEVLAGTTDFYSIHNIKSIGTLVTARIGAWNIERERTLETLNQIYFNEYIDRPEVWESMLSWGFGADQTSARIQLHSRYLYAKELGDLLLNWFGRERIALILAVLSERYRSGSFSLDEFIEVAEEFKTPSGPDLDNWLQKLQPAGFVVSNYEIERLPSATDGTQVYEHSFHVQNGETTEGLITVEYEIPVREGDIDRSISQSTRPIQIERRSSVKIAIHSHVPVEFMAINPFFSLNRTPLEVKRATGTEIPSVTRKPSAMVQPSNWAWRFEGKLCIDDLDPGFSIEPATIGEASRSTLRMIMFNQTDPELMSYDLGLRVFDPNTSESATEWTRQRVDSSFGVFQRTLVRAEHDATPQVARFTATLPRAGEWELQYHLPDFEDVRGDRNFGLNQNVFQNKHQRGWGDFDIKVAQAEEIHSIRLTAKSLKHGWNSIQKLTLDSDQVTVSVSTRTSSETVVADAICWIAVSDEVSG